MEIIVTDSFISKDESLEKIIEEYYPKKWENLFIDSKEELKTVCEILKNKVYYPINKNIFRLFYLIPPENIKVVIIGQDPYYQTYINKRGRNVPRATGLSFSVNRDDSVPVSLKNIYSEISKNYNDFKIPNHGNLEKWIDEGVFMLNKCLTVKPGEPGSHKNIWLGFIRKVILEIHKYNKNCIYVLWGREACSIKPLLNSSNIVLETSYFSGFSIDKGFNGCKHFSKINEILINQRKIPIDWNLDD
jgi:uracil-DNA glycosylase